MIPEWLFLFVLAVCAAAVFALMGWLVGSAVREGQR